MLATAVGLISFTCNAIFSAFSKASSAAGRSFFLYANRPILPYTTPMSRCHCALPGSVSARHRVMSRSARYSARAAGRSPWSRRTICVARILLGEALSDVEIGAVFRQSSDEVALVAENVAHSLVGKREVALPLGVAWVLLCQMSRNVEDDAVLTRGGCEISSIV